MASNFFSEGVILAIIGGVVTLLTIMFNYLFGGKQNLKTSTQQVIENSKIEFKYLPAFDRITELNF